MSGNRGIWLLVLMGVLFPQLGGEAAAAPWDGLFTLCRVEADPQKSYRLTDQNGPWMILACTFSGDNAEEEARALVLELRKRYKLPAYVYKKKFDFSQETYGRGIDQFGAPLKMQYQRGSQIAEIAVMVGDYPSVDDPQAQATLQKLKYARPECLELEANRSTSRTLAGLRVIQQAILKPGNSKKKKGPMGHAFVTTNPLRPRDHLVPKGVDKFVLEMNDENKYSLLNCPGTYSVQVAHFTGRVIINQRDIEAIENGRRMESKLLEAGEKAEQLCEALRMKGYEAYVFHDRSASIVTVGSFDSVGTPRSDGRIEINPQIHAIMKTFGAEQTTLPGRVGGVMEPKTLVGIPFDIQPIPVQVPKCSVAADYRRDSLPVR